jgi:FSR family fosmidomycin resistance protein-like MFS transporter
VKGEGQLSLLRNGPLLALGLGHAVVDLCANTLPIFYPLLATALGLSYGGVAALTTVQTSCSSISQPFFGWLSDRFGSRWLASLSIVAAAMALALVGFLHSYVALLLIVAVLGLSVGAFHPQGAKTAALLGGRWRTTALSVYMVIANVGLSAGPLLAATLVMSAGLQGTALLLIPALPAGALLFRALGPVDRLLVRKATGEPAEKVGPIAWAGVVALVVTIVVRSWVEYGLLSFVPLLYAARGEAPDLAGRVLFLLLIMEGTGSLIGGLLADHLGRKPVLVGSFLLMAPVVHLFVGSPGPDAALPALAAGFLLGAPLTVTLAAAQEIVPSRMGVASGLAISSGMIVGGAGVSLQGVLADRFGLQASLGILVAAAVVATAAALGVSGRRSRPL